MGKDGFAGELTVAEGVQHRGVGAQEAAPAHSYGGKDSNGVAVDPTLCREIGDQAQSRSNGSEGRDRESYLVRIPESEQPLEQPVHLVGEPGE